MSLGWLPISLLSVLYPCFEIEENSNPYLNPIKIEKTRQIEFCSSKNPWIRVLLPSLNVVVCVAQSCCASLNI